MHHQAPVLPLSFSLALLASAGAVDAQSIAVSASANSPVTASCSTGGQPVQQTLPAGPLQPASYLVEALSPAGARPARAAADGFTISTASSVAFAAQNRAWHASPFPGDVAAVTQDLTLQITATGPAPVTLLVVPTLLLSPGAPAPLMQIDVQNDGSVEWNGAFGAVFLGNFVLGAQPLTVRLQLVSQLSATTTALAESFAAIELRIEPDNQISTTLEAAACVADESTPPVPIFEGYGVELSGAPGLLVFGFDTFPVLLGPQSPIPFLPGCLLMPTPDVLVWDPIGIQQLPLPAALRPATLHVQRVLPWTQFALGAAFAIHAN